MLFFGKFYYTRVYWSMAFVKREEEEESCCCWCYKNAINKNKDKHVWWDVVEEENTVDAI